MTDCTRCPEPFYPGRDGIPDPTEPGRLMHWQHHDIPRYVPPPLPEEWADEEPCVDGGAHKPTSNEHADAWCVRCGERLLIPGYAGGPDPIKEESQ